MGYEFTFYSVTEGEEIVQVCVVIRDPEIGGAPREFSVISTTRNGSAGELKKQLHIFNVFAVTDSLHSYGLRPHIQLLFWLDSKLDSYYGLEPCFLTLWILLQYFLTTFFWNCF